MADEKTQADSFRAYHTGASTIEGAQATADSSLGGWPSNSALSSLAASTSGLPSNITLDDVGGYSGEGTAYINFPATSTAQYKAPGSSSYGDAVTIANGETKILLDGDDDSMFARITRTSTDNLTGTATLTLTDVFNNAAGLDDITSAEATAGDDEYRVLAVKQENSTAAQNLKVWIKPYQASVTSDTAQLGASGSGTITTTGSTSNWPDSGMAVIKDSGGTLQEIVYYSANDGTNLTVPAAGRGALGTSASAGSATDTVEPVPPIRIAIEAATTVGTDTFTGSGLDDLTTSGTATVKAPKEYRVEIDGTGTPDTFKWSNDGGSTWEATTVSITGSAQTLENGVQITFGATTGHTSGDRWDFDVGKSTVCSDEDTAPSGITFQTKYTETNGLDDGDGDFDQDEWFYIHIHREVVAGAVADTDVLNQIRMSFDAA